MLGEVLGADVEVRTGAEQETLVALRTAYPRLAPRYGAALRQARAVGLGKLWRALARERFDGLVPSAGAGRARLLRLDGAWLSAPAAIMDMAGEPPQGLTVTLHGSQERVIDHPVALLEVVASGPDRQGLAAELASSVANHALALVGESRRRERLAYACTDPPGGNALRWAAQRASADRGFSPLTVFEQAVVDGHPLHPCARIRGGMTTEELFAYAPEWAEEVALGLVAVAGSAFTEHSCDGQGMTTLLRRWHARAACEAEAYLRGLRCDPADYVLVPAHPWQVRRILPERYAGALADGRVLVVPQARVRARPLLSLRTFAAVTDRRAAHMKTAVDVRLTTAVRTVSPATARNGPVVSRLLAEIRRRERGFGGRFVALTELASGNYRPAEGEPASSAASLAAVVRESPERYASDGEVALPGAALSARSPLSGQPLLADVLDELAATHRLDREHAASRFLASYCDCTLPALFALLSRWGVALEPHGQNIVVVLRGGVPVRVVYRDFGGIRVSPARLASRGLSPPELTGSLPTDDENELRAKLLFPLIDTNLSQVVPTLARHSGSAPGRLWELVAARCRTIYAALTGDLAIRAQARRDEAALFGPTIPTKSMLRMQLSADPHAPQWIAVPNPLAAAS